MISRPAYIYFVFILSLSLVACNNERSMSISFLLENQQGHFTKRGTMVDSFLNIIYATETIPRDSDLKKAWLSVADVDKSITIPDKNNIQQDLLVEETDFALETWHKSPWKDEVSFDMFCRYILPYRMNNEEARQPWRKTLHDHYCHLIVGVKDMKKAFEIIHGTIEKSFNQTDIKIPYILSLIDLDKIQHGNCSQRCVYEAGVMRALGIPVAIDGLYEWANYSTSGHAWVSLVTKDGTYTVSREDSVARKFNPIDASIVRLKLPLGENYDHDIDNILEFRKSSARVIRNTFENCQSSYHDKNADILSSRRFANPFVKDVSYDYFHTSDIVIESNEEYGYLCIFKTGADWAPITYTKSDRGQMAFKNMGDSVVYLFGYYKKGNFIPKGNPFLFTNGTLKYLNPDRTHYVDLHLYRKYPMTTQFVNYWIRVKDGYFAASNNQKFKDSTLLHYITYIPSFRNEVSISSNKKYRYYRYGMNAGTKHHLAEIQFFHHGQLCKGKMSYYNVKDVEKGFDGDTFSYFEGRKPFWINIDMGEPVNIDTIVFFARNDDNYVIPGDDYELFYYDQGWQSLGVKHSTGYRLDYSNVPSNALYVLRNKTRGKEERIFTYENGKQVWW